MNDEILNEFENESSENTNNGPLEMNILERVEEGLQNINNNINEESITSKVNSKIKFQGRKKVVKIIGTANIDNVYLDFILNIFFKIFIIISMLFNLKKDKEKEEVYVIYTLFSISCFIMLKNLVNFFRFLKVNRNIQIKYLIDFVLHFFYLIYFIGFYFVFKIKIVDIKYLSLFAIPILILGLILHIIKQNEYDSLGNYKFLIFESIQWILIYIKFSFKLIIPWNYILLYYIAVSIFMVIIGIILFILSLVALKEFNENRISKIHFKSILIFSIYYFFTGIFYFQLIKGFCEYINDNKNKNYILAICYFYLIISFILLILSLIWNNSLKVYYKKILFKSQFQEISVRNLNNNFCFNVVKISSNFYKKENEESKQNLNSDADNAKMASNTLEDKCYICYERNQECLIYPCNHSGICSVCIIREKEERSVCPLCKLPIKNIYLMEYDQKLKKNIIKKELVFSKK